MKNRRLFYHFFKRILDIFCSFTGLIILSPVFIVVYFIVQGRMGNPVIFRHPRAGKHGKPFMLYKFRTMTEDKDSSGNLLKDEERLTPFGNKLRGTSLDELPQLLNVIKGDMSLVGPRPLLLEYVPLYSKEQAKRLEVKPGITGWAQVNGRNALSWEEKFDLDMWYVKNRSIWLDIKIILATALKVLKKEDISQDGHATMEKFRGSE